MLSRYTRSVNCAQLAGSHSTARNTSPRAALVQKSGFTAASSTRQAAASKSWPPTRKFTCSTFKKASHRAKKLCLPSVR